jgi:hypothetical protein
MGCYDTFIKGDVQVQLKAGACILDCFEVGSKISEAHEMEDGVYIAPDGIVTISNGTLIDVTEKAFTKWINSEFLPGTDIRNVDYAFKFTRVGSKCYGMEDGAYISQDGIVVVSNGVVVEVTEKVFTKWGNKIDIKELVNPYDHWKYEI